MENDAEKTYPRAYKPKPPLKAKIIRAIGGEPNGTGDTWTFTTGQLKKLGWAVALLISFAFAGGGRLDRFAKLPEDVLALQESFAKAETCNQAEHGTFRTEHGAFRQQDALFLERNENMAKDLKYLREDVSFIREQLERRK